MVSDSRMSVSHTISYVLDGFPVQTTIDGADADRVRSLVQRLQQIGAVPPPVVAPTPPAAPATERRCPIHGTPLRERSGRGGGRFWSCPVKDGGEWCKHTEE